MPKRFESHAYSAEITKLMKHAFEMVWLKVKLVEDDVALTRKLLASAVIDQVDRGIREGDVIVSAAIAALVVARNSR